MRARHLSLSVALALLTTAGIAQADPGHTQIIWGSYNGYVSTTGATSSSLSRDGGFVVFHSENTILVPGMAPDAGYYWYDTEAFGASWLSSGTGTPGISADGQTAVYRDDGAWSWGPGIFTSAGHHVSVAIDGSFANAECGDSPQISASGRYVAFSCAATNLVAADTNGAADIFVRDLQAATTRRVNLGPGGVQANAASDLDSISSQGRYVVFTSSATNLVQGDTNGFPDVFLRDRSTGVTERISLGAAGGQANGPSRHGFVSADGRYVVFTSRATNLVPGDSNGAADDAFLRDRVAGTTERLSENRNGVQANAATEAFGISGDGRRVVMVSAASNLAFGDKNPGRDVFVLDRDDGRFEIASVNSEGVQAEGDALHAAIGLDGNAVSFSTTSRLDALHRVGGYPQLYVHQLSNAPADAVTLSPGSHDFGTRPLYTRTQRTFTLRNSGSSAVTDLQWYVDPFPYTGITGTSDCGATLAAGASCNVVVSYYPRTERWEMALLAVRFGAERKELYATLAGTGDRSEYALAPNALEFGAVAAGASSEARYATVRNTGAVALPIRSITLQGRNAGQFAMKPNCPNWLPAGASCSIRVVFKPTWRSTMSATLQVDAGGGAPTRSVLLSGTGT